MTPAHRFVFELLDRNRAMLDRLAPQRPLRLRVAMRVGSRTLAGATLRRRRRRARAPDPDPDPALARLRGHREEVVA
jgi:hypothetical protein